MNLGVIDARPRLSDRTTLFVIESLLSIGGNFLMAGIYFYTQRRLGWGIRDNLLLATAQGLAYMPGALLANRVAALVGRRRGLTVLFVLTTVAALFAMVLGRSAWIALPVTIFTFFLAMCWPMIESLFSANLDSETLSRYISLYNIDWAVIGVISIAIEGTFIEHFPPVLFLLPALAGLICAVLIWRYPQPIEFPGPHAAVAPDPILIRKRSLALWLSRISLPATYVIVYSFMAILPSLPILKPFTTGVQTAIGSIWMAGRVGVFCLLAFVTWWHTRPRLLLVAVLVMGVGFLGASLRISAIFGVSSAVDLPAMILFQIFMGGAIGLIYQGSLFFGMVLSQGSTEHGGYHEALIGLGSIIGPGFAAIAAVIWPGRPDASVAAIAVIVAVSAIAAGGVTVNYTLNLRKQSRMRGD